MDNVFMIFLVTGMIISIILGIISIPKTEEEKKEKEERDKERKYKSYCKWRDQIEEEKEFAERYEQDKKGDGLNA